MKLYDWQEHIRDYDGNLTIRGGRQTGKSEAVADRIFRLAFAFRGSKILVIAASERQENYLIEKVKARLGKNYKYRSRATLQRLPLSNGTTILKYPVGMTGMYIEGLSSVDFLFVDEAIHIGLKVFDSIIPMLAEPRKRGLGWITLLSATKGRPKGYFYDSFKKDSGFEQIRIKAEDCPHISKEFLKEEYKRLGETMYGVIYDGEFSEHAYKYFPQEIIDQRAKIATWSHKAEYNKAGNYYLGIDPARFGRSKAAFCVVELVGDKVRVLVDEVMAKSSLLQLESKVMELEAKFNFRKIFIDDGGVGAGLVDILEKLKRKVRALNATAKGYEKRILKEDLYSNALRLMETEKLELLKKPEFLEDLKKVEYTEDEKIDGTDRSEAFVRACWCTKEKKLRLFRY